MTDKYLPLLLLVVFLLLYLLLLGTRPLFIPDETRYAEVPREMITTGDWIVPRINGLRYFEKPVMGYWINALSIMALGENNFAVRLPSALACGLVSIMVVLLCGFSCGYCSLVPWLAALVFLTSPGVVSIGGFAVLDSVLTFFITAALICFFLACEQQAGSGKERFFLFSAGLLAGCAFLTKGFLAFAVLVLTAAPYLVWQNRRRDCFRMLWLPLAGAVLVSLPWAICIHMREPDFWFYFFWNEHFRRFFADSAQHKQPFWFYLAVLPAMYMPWIFILPAAVAGLRTREWQGRTDVRLLRYCLCWFVFPFLFFSASSGKLITYILPCFPPLAILSGLGFSGIIKKNMTKSFQIGAGAASLFTGLTMVGLIVIQLFGQAHLHPFTRSWKWILLVNGLAVMILFLVAAIRSQQVCQKLIFFGLAPVFLLFIAHFAMPAMTLKRKAPGPLLQRYVKNVNNTTVILSGEEVARAVCWYFKRDDVYLVERAGELQYGLDHEESRWRLTPETAGKLIRKHPGNVILVADQEEYGHWQPFLPKPVMIDSTGSKGYLILRY